MKEFKIRINDQFITVNEEIYITYYKMERRERYLEEVCVVKNLSYDQLTKLNYPIEGNMCESQQPLEDAIVEKVILEKIIIAVNMLTVRERIIITELFVNGTSIRELSLYLKVPKSTLHDQKDIIIEKIRKVIEKL